MPKVPSPITSPPNVPGQPWDATAEGAVGKWTKTTEGGAASFTTGEIDGDWPANGTSGDGGWQQT